MPNGSSSNPCFQAKKPRPVGQQPSLVASSTASCGSSGRAPPGGTCRNALGRGAPSPVASSAGSRRVSGNASLMPPSSRPRRPTSSTGTFMLLIAPLSGPPNRRRTRKKGSSGRSAWAQSRRVQHESPPQSGRERSAADPALHSGSATRSHGLSPVDGQRCGEAAWARPPPTPSLQCCW
jgi:hypothetical protein